MVIFVTLYYLILIQHTLSNLDGPFGFQEILGHQGLASSFSISMLKLHSWLELV
ncbi:hypothetical protein GLYMA_09G090550v4 [Glycine max]|nr:hypothetical protein GLYMA_09G090550v4 [Glycine max]KAH1042203.1 hypothetical protein GYH30_024492 [Glycine max]